MTLQQFLLQPMEKNLRFVELSNKIQTNISLSEKKGLEVEFKKDVPYWQRLNWQVQDDIWNDIRMNSKHGFTLFQRFLKENKDLVIQANGNGIDIVKEYQDKFCKTADQYGLRGRQTLKSQQLKQKLSTSPDAFEEILFKRIKCVLQGKSQKDQQSLLQQYPKPNLNIQSSLYSQFKQQQSVKHIKHPKPTFQVNQQASLSSPPALILSKNLKRSEEYIQIPTVNQNPEENRFGKYVKPIIAVAVLILAGIIVLVIIQQTQKQSRLLLMNNEWSINESKKYFTLIKKSQFLHTTDNELNLYSQDISSIFWNFILTLNLGTNLRRQTDIPFSNEIMKVLKETKLMSNGNWHQQISEYYKSQMQNIKASEISLLQEEILQVA